MNKLLANIKSRRGKKKGKYKDNIVMVKIGMSKIVIVHT